MWLQSGYAIICNTYYIHYIIITWIYIYIYRIFYIHIDINATCIQFNTSTTFRQVSLVEKKGELKDAQNALSKDFDVLCRPRTVLTGCWGNNPTLVDHDHFQWYPEYSWTNSDGRKLNITVDPQKINPEAGHWMGTGWALDGHWMGTGDWMGPGWGYSKAKALGELWGKDQRVERPREESRRGKPATIMDLIVELKYKKWPYWMLT